MTDTTARNALVEPCTHCPAAAGQMCIDPYCPSLLGTEFMEIIEPGNLESLQCVPTCANQAHVAGFHPVNTEGGFDDEPSKWINDGRLLGCGACGRVIAQDAVIGGTHLQVIRQLDEPPQPGA